MNITESAFVPDVAADHPVTVALHMSKSAWVAIRCQAIRRDIDPGEVISQLIAGHLFESDANYRAEVSALVESVEPEPRA